MMNLANHIADRLLQINAIKLNAANPFIWSSGLHSPIYCDNRLILSYPEERKIIVKAMSREASRFEPEAIAAAMPKVAIEGLIGPIAFDEKGDIKNGAISIFEVKDKLEIIDIIK